jgi:hypothetical protein
MDELIVELTGRSRESVQRYRFVDGSVRLGRAYDNDVILGDPFVAPHQARLDRDAEGGWVLTDVAAINSTRDVHERPLAEPTTVDSGMIFWLGGTQIRLLSPEHPVAATRTLGRTTGVVQNLDRALLALPLLAMAWLGQSFVDYLGHFHGEARFARHAMVGLTGVVVALLWAANWGLIARITNHRRSRFWGHLSVAAAAVLGLLVVTWAGGYIAYWSNSGLARQVIDMGGMGLIAGAAVFLALIMAVGMRLVPAVAWSSAVSAVVVAFAVLMEVAAQPDFRATPSYVEVLKPPVPFGVPRPSAQQLAPTADAVFDALPEVPIASDGEPVQPSGEPNPAVESDHQ